MNHLSRWQAVVLALSSLTAAGLYISKALNRMSDEESNIFMDILMIGSLLIFAAYSIKQAYAPLLRY